MRTMSLGKPVGFLRVIGAMLVLQISIGMTWAQDTVVAEPPVTQDNAIDFKTVIADFIKVTGGEEAHRAIKSVRAKGRISIPVAGHEGVSTVTQQGGKGLVEMNLIGVRKSRAGYDGETAWQIVEGAEPQILAGEQKEQLVMQMAASPMLQLETTFDSIKCSGIEDFVGEPCHVIVCKKDGHQPVIHYFSVESKLHVGTRITVLDNQNAFESTNRLSDYREVNGVKIPFRNEADLPLSMMLITELESVETNIEIADSVFDLPEDIKALKK